MRKRTLIPLILLILIIGGIWYINTLEVDETKESNIDTSYWSTFSDDQYLFELEYPAEDWNMAGDVNNVIAPKFSFYIKPAGIPVNAPFDHFANITHVSVYPSGIPTEGLMGETESLDGDWGENVSYTRSRIHTLEDGTPFAAYIKFKDAPESWNDSGFVWARLRAENFDSVCFENGVELGSEEQCDPLGNENISIVHRGDVDIEKWPVLKEITKSITFN